MAFERIEASDTGEELVLARPADGAPLGRLPVTPSAAIIDRARELRRVAHAFAELSPGERAGYLARVEVRLSAAGDELVELLASELGKPLAEGRLELRAAIEVLRHHARHGPRWLSGERGRPGARMLRRRQVREQFRPTGVYVYLSSSDHPLLQPCKMLAMLLCGGNVALWKPSEHAALLGARIAELWRAAAPPCGCPVALVQGEARSGRDLVALLGNGHADELAFCGERETAQRIAAELGGRLGEPLIGVRGNNPAIFWRDAVPRLAARAAVRGAFLGAGQSCMTLKRFFVHRELHQAFLEEVEQACAELVIGPGEDPGSTIGPMLCGADREGARAMIGAAVRGGAALVRGGTVPRSARLAGGSFLEPAVLDGCDGEMELFRDGPRGPILAIQTFSSLEESVVLANEGRHGLAASVFGRDPAVLTRIGRGLRVGSVHINDLCWVLLDPDLPLLAAKGVRGAALYGREGLLRCVQRGRFVIDPHPQRRAGWGLGI